MHKKRPIGGKRTIASRLVVYVVLFSTAIMVFVTALQLYLDYKTDIAVIESRLQQIENSSLRTLAHGLWVADKKNMRFHLEGLVELPDMQYFEIRDQYEEWVKVGRLEGEDTIRRKYLLSYLYKNKQYEIGSLIVVASLSGVYDRLIDRAWLVLVSNGTKTFIVSIFLLLMFNHLVTRHIYRVTAFLKSLNLDFLETPLTLDYSKQKHYARNDEINILASGVNAMRSALHDSTNKLKEREQYLASTLNCVGDAVIATNSQGIVTRTNPIAQELLGYAKNEVVDTHLSSIFNLVDTETQSRPKLIDDIPQYLSEVSAIRTSASLITRDGNHCWVYVNASMIENSKKEILGLIITFRDVSQQKAAEEELERHRKNLEELVKERTEKLELTNKELESFCSSVSHDLRAPLRSIKSFSQILVSDLSDTLDSEYQDYLHRIDASAQKMSQLIRDLLNLSRITRAEINKENINLSQMVMNALRTLQDYEPDRIVNITIAQKIIARGDQRYIQILLDNLLSNAWKYTSKTPDPKIEFGVKIENGLNIYFVKDNGAGFDEAFSNKLFIPFQRLHAPTEFEGTGIGLATALRTVEQHGGKIWAKSPPGEGATFYFTLHS